MNRASFRRTEKNNPFTIYESIEGTDPSIYISFPNLTIDRVYHFDSFLLNDAKNIKLLSGEVSIKKCGYVILDSSHPEYCPSSLQSDHVEVTVLARNSALLRLSGTEIKLRPDPPFIRLQTAAMVAADNGDMPVPVPIPGPTHRRGTWIRISVNPGANNTANLSFPTVPENQVYTFEIAAMRLRMVTEIKLVAGTGTIVQNGISIVSSQTPSYVFQTPSSKISVTVSRDTQFLIKIQDGGLVQMGGGWEEPVIH